MIRYFTLVTWEVGRAGESLASQCATVSFCALGRYFYFGFLRAMFSRPEFSSQPLPFVSFVAGSTRLNLARRMEWIGEMISPHFLDAIDEVRNRLEEERRSTKPVAG